MPYNYETLEKHISAVHPELLDAFVQGWNNLGSRSQAGWCQRGFIAPKQKVERLWWLSWTTVQVDELYQQRRGADPFDVPLSKFQKYLTILFHNNMEHVDDLFGLPYMPPIKHGEYSPERHAIAKDAARVVMYTEMGKLLMKWKKDLEEYGLDSLRSVYLTAPQLEGDGEKFDFKDFESDFDCDSDSNETNSSDEE